MTIDEKIQRAKEELLKHGISPELIAANFEPFEVDEEYPNIGIQGRIINAVLEHGAGYEQSDKIIDAVFGAGTATLDMGVGIKGMTLNANAEYENIKPYEPETETN